ncbi:MAG: hypothetical protein HY329_18330 [Chloroflexi bacterium]|nr:hypothetical protein [Chloroflexota bacterium]
MTTEVERVETRDDVEAIYEQYYASNWTDGLPIIPPTAERVERMLAGAKRDRHELIGVLEPKKGEATVETIAVNAVMAGCRPEYLPVLIAATEALADPALNLYSILTATHNVSPLAIVSGPIARRLDVNCGEGQAPNRWRASATIGRAIQLLTINVAGIPGGTHIDTQGPMGRYYNAMAENEEESPWEPLHAERGFRPEQSTVTIFAANPAQHIDDVGSNTPQSILHTMANAIATGGNRNMHGPGEPLLVLGLQHANTIGKAGWSKLDAKRFLYENARIRHVDFPPGNESAISEEWRKYFVANATTGMPCAGRPEDIVILVIGGSGTHSLFVQTVLGCWSVTRLIEE